MALKVGDKAPHFSLLNDKGQHVSLQDFLGKKVVLYFYPKDLTPGCTTEACDFRDALAQFKDKNCVVLGVSKDSVASHEKFREKHGLNFSLLADTEGQVCELYEVWKNKKLYGKTFLGVVRTSYVIDEKGVIAEIFENVKVKGHIDRLLQSI